MRPSGSLRNLLKSSGMKYTLKRKVKWFVGGWAPEGKPFQLNLYARAKPMNARIRMAMIGMYHMNPSSPSEFLMA